MTTTQYTLKDSHGKVLKNTSYTFTCVGGSQTLTSDNDGHIIITEGTLGVGSWTQSTDPDKIIGSVVITET